MKSFIPCRYCKDKGPRPGYIYYTVPLSEGDSQKAVKECDCHKQYKQTQLLRNKAIASFIWPNAFTYNPDVDYKGTKSGKENVLRLKHLIERFGKEEYPEVQSSMTYLYGPNGTQKTTLAQWVGAKLLEKGFTVHYTVMQTLLETASKLHRDQEKVDEQDGLLKLYKTVDYLIVDESFSKDKVTLYNSGYQLPFLDRLLRERFDIGKKGIMFVSNVAPGDIANNNFSISQQDFILRNTRHKTALLFTDNFMEHDTQFEIKGLFD